MGKKDRELIARGFVDINRLVNVSFFWMDVSNPFPWVSGSWPVTGPTAFTGRAPDRVGVTVTVRTPLEVYSCAATDGAVPIRRSPASSGSSRWPRSRSSRR